MLLQVFEDLLEEHLPAIHKHLDEMGFPFALVTFSWFVCFYLGYLSFEVQLIYSITCTKCLRLQTSLRFLDVFFYQGDARFHFCLGLALFKMNGDFILSHRDPVEIDMALKKNRFPCDTLIKVSLIRVFLLLTSHFSSL